jgi:CRP-like cAMP-binding protein
MGFTYRNRIIDSLILFTIGSGHVLFKEGDVGNFFYIVKSGELILNLPDLDSTKILTQGDTFGELALLQKSERSGTVVSNTITDIYCLDGSVFREIVKKINSVDQNERGFIVKLISIFKGLTTVQISNIALGMIKCEFKEGETIVAEGERSESLFIIRDGSVSCFKNDKEIKKLSSKDYFGESSILFQTKRSMSIVCAKKTVCYQITKNLLQETLGENFRKVLLQGICKESFSNSQIMKNFLIDHYFEKIFNCFKINFYKSEEIIFNGHTEKKLVVVIQGTLTNVSVNFKFRKKRIP